MDAVKFIEEHRRMYKVTGKHLPTLADGIPAEDVVKEVEEWSAAHPRKTRQSVFLEQYPEARIYANGALSICPNTVCIYRCRKSRECVEEVEACDDCCREFWMQEVE